MLRFVRSANFSMARIIIRSPDSAVKVLLSLNPVYLGNPSNCSRCFARDRSHQPPDFLDLVVEKVSEITRTRPRWEQTLVSEFPSVDFSCSGFFHRLFQVQNNVFLSLRFFNWVVSHYNVSPDEDSCALIFDALVDAKAHNATKKFLSSVAFVPKRESFERYVQCLDDCGLVDDMISGLDRLREMGSFPPVVTWNSVLRCCIRARRTDLVWELYGRMVGSGGSASMDAETVDCLIHAFCIDGEAIKGYELLREVIENGMVPQKETFDKLISGFCKERNYGNMSDVLHLMIVMNCDPDLHTYHGVISGLLKNRRPEEALRVFTDLKNRGYRPDIVVYTTMIHGLCEVAWLGAARGLWFEMIDAGISPNKYTYNTLIHGYFRWGHPEKTVKLFHEMCNKGYGENTVSYNTMIKGFCSKGKMDEATAIFEQMPRKGITRDSLTYNSMIRGFCREGNITKGRSLLNELVAVGLAPTASSYIPLIEQLCKMGKIEEGKSLWNDMLVQGLRPYVFSLDDIIARCYRHENNPEAMRQSHAESNLRASVPEYYDSAPRYGKQ